MATTLQSLTTALTGLAEEIAPVVVTVAVAFVAVLGVFLGIRYLVKAAKAIK